LIGQAGVLKCIHDLSVSYLSFRVETILVMTDTWPLARVMGFLDFFKTKYLGGDSVSGKIVQFWHFFWIQNLFSKKFAGFGLFGVYQFHIALVRLDLEL